MTIVTTYYIKTKYMQGNQYTKVPVPAIKKSKMYCIRCDFCSTIFERNSHDAHAFTKQKEHACSGSCAQKIFFRHTPKICKPKLKNGYVYIGDRRQHQIVMERSINRKLIKGECIHHINGDKADNDEENLALCPSIAKHNHVHKQLEDLGMALVNEGSILFCKKVYDLLSLVCGM